MNPHILTQIKEAPFHIIVYQKNEDDKLLCYKDEASALIAYNEMIQAFMDLKASGELIMAFDKGAYSAPVGFEYLIGPFELKLPGVEKKLKKQCLHSKFDKGRITPVFYQKHLEN